MFINCVCEFLIMTMIIHDREYIKPTRIARELSILENLAANSELSQSELGQASFLSGAMINQYLRRMNEQGLIRYVPANGKTFHYQLTEKGEDLRRSMFAAYSSELVRLYSSLKRIIKEKLAGQLRDGRARVALYGASETCEVAMSALHETPFEVVAVVDGDPLKHGKKFHGQIISPPEILEVIVCDAVIITTFAHQEEIIQRIEPLARRKNMEIVPL